MKIDERIWPLPNAFTVPKDSIFGKDEKQIEFQRRSQVGQANGTKTREKKTKQRAKIIFP
jgi:hypothetical protein